ncbi:MAG TPA: hypothetical protein VJ508_12400, partial [Saprospiraceae bacterium]|nr:hypothetical protein [Saprospiraceae bacterium]
MKNLVHLLFIPLLFLVCNGYAQSNTPDEPSEQNVDRANISGNTKGLITGSAWFGLAYNKDADPKFNFNTYGFTPVFIWKLSDKMFLESELEIADGNIELEYAKLTYSLNKYMNIGAGRMLNPFGAYGERWEPAFVERFPNSPLLPDDNALEDDTHLYFGAIMAVDVSGDIPMGSSR